MKLIECKDLCMKYEGITAFEGLTFSVEEGDFLCIVGENGSGKSTLIKGLLGHVRRRKAERDRLSAAADSFAEGLPRYRVGSRAFGLP